MAGWSRGFRGETRQVSLPKRAAEDWKDSASQPRESRRQQRLGRGRQQTTSGPGHLEIKKTWMNRSSESTARWVKVEAKFFAVLSAWRSSPDAVFRSKRSGPTATI